MKFQNKTIVITGAGSGIGRELSLALLVKNAKVIGTDINIDGLEETKKLAGKNADNFFSYKLDISNKSEVESTYKKIIDEHKTVDGLINNAGIIQPFVKINDLDYDAINKVMNVNFFGPLYMTKTFLPHLLKRPEAYITNVSSMGGFLPVPGQSIYGASKAAVKLMTEGLYAELKNTSVHVSVVFPGATNTNITKNSGISAPASSDDKKSNFPTLPASVAAKTIISGMEKNQLQILTGKDSKFLNFLYRLNPVYATNFIAKQMSSLLK